MKMLKRILVLILCVTMTFSQMSICANAAESGTDQYDLKNIEKYIPSEADVERIIAGEDGLESGLFGDVIGTLVKEFSKGVAIGVIQWAGKEFVNSMFGDETQGKLDYMTDLMVKISEKQDYIIDRLEECKELISMTRYQEIIDEYKKTSGGTARLTVTVTKTLENIDADYADKYDEEGKLSPEDEENIRTARITALTRGLGIDIYESGNEDIDNRVSELYEMIMTTYDVPVGKQTSVSRDFFSVYREKMRLTTHWEHLAYDSMEQFNDYMVANFLTAALIQDASLKARYAVCKEQGLSTYTIETVLSQLYEEVANVSKLYNQRKVQRDTSYRHFWVPDHEVTIYQKAFSQTIPDENKTGQVESNFADTAGYTNGSLNWSLWDKIWEPWRYTSFNRTYNLTNMATTDEINELLTGCNHTMTLGEILAEGGIMNIPENAVLILDKTDKTNAMVTDHTTDYGVGYYADFWNVCPRGVKLAQKTNVTNADRIPTYEYAKKYVSTGYFSETNYYVTDKRVKDQKYFTLLIDCPHDWEISRKGLVEMGVCKLCGSSYTEDMMLSAEPIKLVLDSKDTLTYNGKARSLKFHLVDKEGNKLDSSLYTVKVPSGRKNVGKYIYTIKLVNGKTLTKTLTILPKNTVVRKLKAVKRGFTVTWKVQKTKMKKTRIGGYQIRYSLKKNMKNAVKKTIKGYKKHYKKITGLKSKKRYYVQIRTYKKVSGKTICSKWSKVKSIKTK